MKIIYIAGPYRAEGANAILQNILEARAVAIELWKLGYVAIAPHCNTFLMDGAAPDEVWLAGDLEILRRCDLVVMRRGWWDSSGAVAERQEAKSRCMSVYEWPRDRDLLAKEAKT